MTHPTVENAPGLKWLRRKTGWEARWRARLDLKGFSPKSVPLWKGATLDEVPSEDAARYVADQCHRLQAEMLVWGRGGVPQLVTFGGTLRSLIECYTSDPDSRYRSLRFQTRRSYDANCRRLITDHGDVLLSDIKGRVIKRWHEKWGEGGKVAMSHALVGMLRTVLTFGATLLEDEDGAEQCSRIKAILHDMKFKMSKPRGEQVTAEQANAIRAMAHEMGLPSIALAQAFQFDCTLRQKDVIGEWIPGGEPGLSDVTSGNDKWMCGLRWSEIDSNMVLRHTTSKKQKDVEINLRLAPMVMEELRNLPGTGMTPGDTRTAQGMQGDRIVERMPPRGTIPILPTSGPVIVYERTGVPYEDYQFRDAWRRVAEKAGIPAAVRNMDSRAGAISEAFLANAPADHIRQSATHSNISTTQGYNRIATQATAEVMRIRVEHRNKK